MCYRRSKINLQIIKNKYNKLIKRNLLAILHEAYNDCASFLLALLFVELLQAQVVLVEFDEAMRVPAICGEFGYESLG